MQHPDKTYLTIRQLHKEIGTKNAKCKELLHREDLSKQRDPLGLKRKAFDSLRWVARWSKAINSSSSHSGIVRHTLELVPLSILGAVSAATALAQQTIQLAQFLVSLHGNIKDAPEFIQTRVSSIERLTANLVRTTAPLQTTQVATVLEAMIVSTKKLLEILQKLNLEDRGKLKKKVFVQWKAALKENDVLLLLDQIERNKSELALCFLQIEA
jgi:hypothetical protein